MGRLLSGQAVERTDVAKQAGAAVSIGAADAPLVAANKDRVEITVQNDHATQIVYLSLGGAAALNTGIRLNAAGGSWTTNAYTGAIRAIASGAATAVLVTEI